MFFKSLLDEIALTNSLLVSLVHFHSDLLTKLRCYELCLQLLEGKEDFEDFYNFIPGGDIWKERVNCGLCGTIDITT